jgi:hypothetical protein
LAVAGGLELPACALDQGVAPGVFGLFGGALLAGLDSRGDRAAGDGADAVLGGLLVLLEAGAGDPRAVQLDVLPAADAPPLLGL